MSQTKIEWTEATWNPVVGCTIVSPGCTNCYAMRAAWRLSHNPKTPQYHGTAKLVNGKPVWTGKMNLVGKVLAAPLRRKKPTTYFVNSMGDLFHEDVPDDWIDQVFAVMALCPQHTFQVLTKRADRMQAYFEEWTNVGMLEVWTQAAGKICGDDGYSDVAQRDFPLLNVWLGVSVEDQRRADTRIPALLDTPAAIRFVSAEPLLGPVDLTFIRHLIPPPAHSPNAHINALEGFGTNTGHTKLDWVIAGGESGPGARPSHPDWFRNLRDQCTNAGVPFFFKQWGEWVGGAVFETSMPAASKMIQDFHGETVLHVGKKHTGRTLDGVIHDGWPSKDPE